MENLLETATKTRKKFNIMLGALQTRCMKHESMKERVKWIATAKRDNNRIDYVGILFLPVHHRDQYNEFKIHNWISCDVTKSQAEKSTNRK